MTIQLSIITPDKVFFNGEAEEIILSTNLGQLGILTGHAPLVTALDINILLFRLKKKWTIFAVMGGFALVKQDNLTVLVNEAEGIQTIDSKEAKKALDNARQQLTKAKNKKQRVSAQFYLKRAQARYKVVQKQLNLN